ncbi:hypothetical protein BLNAU_23557 [Blattamonas nauphoetae]|uniref:Uncharacterized protein n=1 Tax=Blattamonas nauphoetae TaxID=2049346 RepID=A0ABQ9WPW0_9EUKA|nr:hypothetical protein BLNAU_23557 [Blattamonas nauphoetae]
MDQSQETNSPTARTVVLLHVGPGVFPPSRTTKNDANWNKKEEDDEKVVDVYDLKVHNEDQELITEDRVNKILSTPHLRDLSLLLNKRLIHLLNTHDVLTFAQHISLGRFAGNLDIIGTNEDKGDANEKSGKFSLSSKVLIKLIAKQFTQEPSPIDIPPRAHPHPPKAITPTSPHARLTSPQLHPLPLPPTTLPIGGFNLTEVGREKVGKSCPSFILIEFEINIRSLDAAARAQ